MAADITTDQARAMSGVVDLLRCIGDDPIRDGLLNTPARFVDAMLEMTGGLRLDPHAFLETTFDGDQYDEMILVRDVPFHSVCEHHLLPFSGHATLGYLPGPAGRIVGLSKLPRMFHAYARRPQVQERLTRQAADAMNTVLRPQGCGVIVRAHHTCMSLRGACTDGVMVTSALLGDFRTNRDMRAEFLALGGAT